MLLTVGERVYWGASEVIYLEGRITALHKEAQTVVVHIDRTTPHSAHLIGTDVSFAANGVNPLRGDSPPGTTSQASERQPPPVMNDEDKIRRTAAIAVHQQKGYALPAEQEQELIAQVAQALNNDPALRARIIASMDEILRREW